MSTSRSFITESGDSAVGQPKENNPASPPLIVGDTSFNSTHRVAMSGFPDTATPYLGGLQIDGGLGAISTAGKAAQPSDTGSMLGRPVPDIMHTESMSAFNESLNAKTLNGHLPGDPQT
jgi:hypothetical protein